MTCPSCTDLSERLATCRVAIDRLACLVGRIDALKGIHVALMSDADLARRALIKANAALAKERVGSHE